MWWQVRWRLSSLGFEGTRIVARINPTRVATDTALLEEARIGNALEPILRVRAAELGARLRYRIECMSLEQDADGGTAGVRELEDGWARTGRGRAKAGRAGHPASIAMAAGTIPKAAAPVTVLNRPRRVRP